MVVKEPKEKKNSNASIEKVRAMVDLINDMDITNKHVCISLGNGKLGNIGNVPLPPIISCGCAGIHCQDFCFAVRSFLRMGADTIEKATNNPWLVNMAILIKDPNRYFKEISNACFTFRFFRWHVSGDILNYNYFCNMVDIAVKNPHCTFLAFTKQYHIVNKYCEDHRVNAIPSNLKLLYSAVPGLDMSNDYSFPECHIAFEDIEKNTFKGCAGNVHHCGGNCESCIGQHCGCFNLNHGDVTIINQH